MTEFLEKRFWEIDAARGIALVLMIISNLVTDIYFFKTFSVDINSGFWFWFARFVASIFIFLVGVSLWLSYSKAVKSLNERELKKKFLLRGLKIFGWGLAITAFTWFFLKQGFVVFGVLHLIGIATLLAFPFLKIANKKIILLSGILVILFGVLLYGFVFDFPWLLWIGFVPKGFFSVDYFPLLPWFGVMLIGLFFGKLLYRGHERRFRVPDFSRSIFTRFVCFLGRHSLKIYLLHQPAIIGLLLVFGFARI